MKGRLMGFFKNLLSKGVKDLANSEGVSKSNRGTSEGRNVFQRVRNVVNTYYPGYTLEENVNTGIFGGAEEAWNYSFVLSQAGTPALTIMVLSGHNDYRKKPVVSAHNASEVAGVHCINIMEYLPSGEAYINQRIAQYIR